MLLNGLPPVFDEHARVLILGSFPSVASLSAQQYYAHPRNQFWPILGALLGQPLAALPYAQRLAITKAGQLAIWDSYAACERAGSLDSAIGSSVPNDIAALKKSALALRRVCFNGRFAARRARELAELGLETVTLPSTSPAYAGMRFEDKLDQWRLALTIGNAS